MRKILLSLCMILALIACKDENKAEQANAILNNKNFNSSFEQYDIDKEEHINTPSTVKQLEAGKLKEIEE